MEDNLRAFLDTIRFCEGTSEPDGYNTLFGGDHFHSYDTHPNILVVKSGYKSTAAGAYQILYKTWMGIKEVAGVKDFTPRSQDLMCKALIRRRGALLDVLEGRFRQAILKCNKEWASLPGSPYGQPTKNMDQIEKYYLSRGGEAGMKYIPATILIIVCVGSFHLFPNSKYLKGFRHGAIGAGLCIGFYWLFSPRGSKV